MATNTIYLHGPSLWGYGFWEGASEADICSSVTGVSSAFWMTNESMCLEIIERKSDAFLLGICGTLVLFVFGMATCRCMFVDPIVDAIKDKR